MLVKLSILIFSALVVAMPIALHAQTADQFEIPEGFTPIDEIDPSEWLEVGTSTHGTLWQLRAKDFFNSSDESPTVWFKLDHSKDKTEKHRKSMSLINFDCGSRKSKYLSSISYAADGSVASSFENPYPQYTYVAPETMIEAAMEAACPSKT